MNQNTFNLLDFQAIRDQLATYAVSELGRKMIAELMPKTQRSAVALTLRETSEAKNILNASGAPPLYGLADFNETFQKVSRGAVLDPLTLQAIGDFLRGCRKTREYMEKRLDLAPLVAGYSLAITPLPQLEEELSRCIVDGTVSNDASPELRRLRKELGRIKEKIQSKLQHYIMSPESREWLQETVVTQKEGHPVLMIKASFKQKIPGIVFGSSGSGSTLFIQPLTVRQLSDELKQLEGAEQEEVYQIIATLSGMIGEQIPALNQNLEIMAQYDLAFAKARFSRAIQGVEPALNDDGRINLREARHPLLAGTPVPLNSAIGHDYRSLVITGPNTGGKTIALKTIGLLTVLAQAGLHIPAAAGSEIAIFEQILADIGDGQSITQSLSTFSAHISNIIAILAQCSGKTLVLLDEIGTGTDPIEGAALATAILEYIHEQGAITVATTHYPEIKSYALTQPGFKNGAMAFDRDKLKPLYHLIIGQPGASQALWIAARLGMPETILHNAQERLGEESSLVNSTKQFDATRPSTPADPLPTAEQRATAPDSPLPTEPPTPEPPVKTQTATVNPIKVGDRVNIPFLNEQGVVCSNPDAKGRIRVRIQEKTMELSLKRVKLLIPAEQLYPENYDLNIVLLSKEERRQKHQMERKHLPGVSRIIAQDEQ